MLRLGKSSRSSPDDFLISLDDLCMHLVVLGESGFGKTTLITDLLTQISNLRPSMPWLVFDLKGEYLHQLPRVGGLQVLRPSFGAIEARGEGKQWTDNLGRVHQATVMPLRMDLLDSSNLRDGEGGIRRVISRITALLKESLSSSLNEGSDLSPLMERILWEVLHNAFARPNDDKGFFDVLIEGVEEYVGERGRGRGDIVRSGEALINRLEKFRRGYLSEVLNRGEPTLTSSLLSRAKVIVDLSECVAHGGLDDLRLLLNLVVEKVFEEATKRGLTQRHMVRHLTVVEEANLLVPEMLRRKSTGDITSTEEMFLIARGYGEGFILVAQRPTISGFTLSNAGTKVIFRTPCDARRVGEILGINEFGQVALKNFQKFEAFAVTIEGGPKKIVTPKPRPVQHEMRERGVSAELLELERTVAELSSEFKAAGRSMEFRVPSFRSPRSPAKPAAAPPPSPTISIKPAENLVSPKAGGGQHCGASHENGSTGCIHRVGGGDGHLQMRKMLVGF